MSRRILRMIATGLLGGGGIVAPTKPTGLTATQISTTQVDLAWTDNATDETEYRVYRSSDGVTYALVDTIAADSSTYSDITAVVDLYWYKVAPFNGKETMSDAATVTVKALIDAFTDTNGTAIADHAPSISVAGSWAVLVGSAEIQSNKLAPTTVPFRASFDVGIANVSVSCVVDPNANGNAGVILRASDASNYFWLRWSATKLQIYKVEGGSFALLAETDMPGASGDAHTIICVANGTSFTATIGAVSVSSTSAFNQTVTKHGVVATNVADRFDSIEVSPL